MASPVVVPMNRPGVAQAVYRVIPDNNPQILVYYLPTSSLTGRMPTVLKTVAEAGKINAHVAIRLLEMQGVEQLTLYSRNDRGGQPRDAISIRFREGTSPETHRARIEDVMFEVAANMDANNRPRNPQFSLYPDAPQMDKAALDRHYTKRLAELKQKNPDKKSDDELAALSNAATVYSILDEFREKAIRVHSGDITLVDMDFPTKTLYVSLSQACGACFSGQGNTINTLQEVCRFYAGNVIQTVKLAKSGGPK